jgi:hypothetical protein
MPYEEAVRAAARRARTPAQRAPLPPSKGGTPGAFATRPWRDFDCQRAKLARRRFSEAFGASPEFTVSFRSLRRLTEAAVPCRSFGGPPKPRSATDPSEAHRSCGVPPKLRSRTEAAERHRRRGVPPKLRRLTEAAVSLRRIDASPKLRSAVDPAKRHRRRGAPPKLRRLTEAAATLRVLRTASEKNKKGGAHTAHPWMNVRTQSWGDRADRPASVAAAPEPSGGCGRGTAGCRTRRASPRPARSAP